MLLAPTIHDRTGHRVTNCFVAEDVDAAWDEIGRYLLHDAMSYSQWNPDKPVREQTYWDDHARFMDALFDAGEVILSDANPADDQRRCPHLPDGAFDRPDLRIPAKDGLPFRSQW